MYIRKYISVYKKIYRSIYENLFPHMRKFRHLLGALLGYLLASGVAGWRNVMGAEAWAELPDEIYAGRAFRLVVKVSLHFVSSLEWEYHIYFLLLPDPASCVSI